METVGCLGYSRRWAARTGGTAGATIQEAGGSPVLLEGTLIYASSPVRRPGPALRDCVLSLIAPRVAPACPSAGFWSSRLHHLGVLPLPPGTGLLMCQMAGIDKY